MLKDASFLFELLRECLDAQERAVQAWHESEPKDVTAAQAGHDPDSLVGLVLGQNFMNCTLWHIEDTARRTDVDDSVIADCKRRIDRFNQLRNDFLEKVDETLVHMLHPCLPPDKGNAPRHNTESMGMAVDRLSILALKIFHMKEQTERSDVDETHRENSRKKLATLREQRTDLFRSLTELVEEFLAGTKAPKAYYQFKMYNDPALNPEVYKNK